MQGYATARQNGWMSANDIRELENLDRIPAEEGGDLYLVNGNVMPLSMSGAAYMDNGNMPGDQNDKNYVEKEEKNPNESDQEEVLEVEESGRKRIGQSA